jgi:hypothetical protein
MHRFLAAAVLAALPGVAFAQVVESVDVPGGDAGIAPTDAYSTVGSGDLATITGATFLFPFDPVDSYLISITDPDNFYATTSNAVDPRASVDVFGFDTRLFLFTPDGTPVLANDDTSGSDFTSTIRSPQSFLGGTVNSPAPLVTGDYVLSLAGFEDDPIDAGGNPLFGTLGLSPTSLFGPSPTAGAYVQYESEAGFASFEAQDYVIALNGASFAVVPEPATAGLAALVCGTLLRRRR